MTQLVLRFWGFMLIAVLLTAGGAAQSTVDLATDYPDLEPRPLAEWTILAYYGGDNDLESHILNDFNEFELAGGSTEQVRILVLLDRLPGGYTSPENDWSGARLYEVQADTSADQAVKYPPTLDSQPWLTWAMSIPVMRKPSLSIWRGAFAPIRPNVMLLRSAAMARRGKA